MAEREGPRPDRKEDKTAKVITKDKDKAPGPNGKIKRRELNYGDLHIIEDF